MVVMTISFGGFAGDLPGILVGISKLHGREIASIKVYRSPTPWEAAPRAAFAQCHRPSPTDRPLLPLDTPGKVFLNLSAELLATNVILLKTERERECVHAFFSANLRQLSLWTSLPLSQSLLFIYVQQCFLQVGSFGGLAFLRVPLLFSFPCVCMCTV